MAAFNYEQPTAFNPYYAPSLWTPKKSDILENMNKYYELQDQAQKLQKTREEQRDEAAIAAAVKRGYQSETGDLDLKPVMQTLWETGNWREALMLYQAMQKTDSTQLIKTPLTSDLIKYDKKTGTYTVIKKGEHAPAKPKEPKQEIYINPEDRSQYDVLWTDEPNYSAKQKILRNRGWVKDRLDSGQGKGLYDSEGRLIFGSGNAKPPTRIKTEVPQEPQQKSAPISTGRQKTSELTRENQGDVIARRPR